MTHTEKMADFSQNWPISDRFRARSCSNDLFNDVLTFGLVLECITNKGKLNQKAESRGSFEPKQIIFWVKVDDPKKCFFYSKQTILVKAAILIDAIQIDGSKLFRLFLYTKADDHSQNLKGEGRSYRLCKLFTLNYGWSENWVRDWLRVQLGMGCHLSRDEIRVRMLLGLGWD